MGKATYTEIATLSHPDSTACAAISFRVMPDGKKYYSIMVGRKFISDTSGEGRTPWLRPREIDIAKDLLDRANARVSELIELDMVASFRNGKAG